MNCTKMAKPSEKLYIEILQVENGYVIREMSRSFGLNGITLPDWVAGDSPAELAEIVRKLAEAARKPDEERKSQ